MRGLITFVATLLVLMAVQGEGQDMTRSAESSVRAVLEAQVTAWNRGDLEGYMEGYWHSPDLEFYSGDTITLGWQQTLERYRRRYQGEGREMGHLDFSGLQVHTNVSNVVWVAGRWHLKMKDGSEKGGLFTLIVHKFPEGWKIIHDHTS